MLETLKDTGWIRAELLTGSEGRVVGEGIKSLNEQASYGLGNQNKGTRGQSEAVKHFVDVLFVHSD